MENAIKALIIAAGVLIGVMIISLGISLYTSLRAYVNDAQEERDINAVQKFNGQFTKYINCNDNKDEPKFTITIQDIATVANIAYENNKNNNLTEPSTGNDGRQYVKVSMPGYDNLEQVINVEMTEILSANFKTYRCTVEDVKINQITGRVYEIIFHEDKT